MQHLIFIPSAVWIKKTTNTLSLALNGWDGIDCGFEIRESLISLSTISSVYLHLVRVSLSQLHRSITIILDNFSRLDSQMVQNVTNVSNVIFMCPLANRTGWSHQIYQRTKNARDYNLPKKR